MGERTSHPAGAFSWVDLATSDPEAAKEFYGELFGWETEDMPAGEGATYTMASLDGKNVAALYRAGEAESAMPPHWNNYVTVDSAEESASRARSLGGNVLMEPFDVLSAGRMSVLQDPTGAVLCAWEPRDHIGAQLVNAPGCLTWNDLSTTDPHAAGAFYSSLFGWTAEQPDGVDDYWTWRNDDRLNGGMRKLSAEETGMGIPSNWMPYFAVEDLDAAVARIEELGGRVHVPPSEVPAGRFAVGQDPQGAVFALFEGELED